MSIRNKYEQELLLVFDKLVKMCRATENAIEQSIKAFSERDVNLAKQIMANDKTIDKMERDLEQDCLKILLMEHPVASDFRDISAALKMITDLERIADQAADISEISTQFSKMEYAKEPEHIKLMADLAIEMVKDGVLSYINKDVNQARELDKQDDKMDLLFETVKADMIQLIKNNPKNADQAILFMMVAKYLERIGDHAVNIGEWVEYTVTGQHK